MKQNLIKKDTKKIFIFIMLFKINFINLLKYIPLYIISTIFLVFHLTIISLQLFHFNNINDYLLFNTLYKSFYYIIATLLQCIFIFFICYFFYNKQREEDLIKIEQRSGINTKYIYLIRLLISFIVIFTYITFYLLISIPLLFLSNLSFNLVSNVVFNQVTYL
ncbi:hypothetical protein STURO_v1c03310 [Spiroplasma turonicum]|nr:hypothetical protein STURO_v1c03310 [Spiroplasma turonicum]